MTSINVECFSCNKTYEYPSPYGFSNMSKKIYKRCEHKYLCNRCWMGKTGRYLYMTNSELVCKLCEQEDRQMDFFEWWAWV
jgi:hypothetical protein